METLTLDTVTEWHVGIAHRWAMYVWNKYGPYTTVTFTPHHVHFMANNQTIKHQSYTIHKKWNSNCIEMRRSPALRINRLICHLKFLKTHTIAVCSNYFAIFIEKHSIQHYLHVMMLLLYHPLVQQQWDQIPGALLTLFMCSHKMNIWLPLHIRKMIGLYVQKSRCNKEFKPCVSDVEDHYSEL